MKKIWNWQLGEKIISKKNIGSSIKKIFWPSSCLKLDLLVWWTCKKRWQDIKWELVVFSTVKNYCMKHGYMKFNIRLFVDLTWHLIILANISDRNQLLNSIFCYCLILELRHEVVILYSLLENFFCAFHLDFWIQCSRLKM